MKLAKLIGLLAFVAVPFAGCASVDNGRDTGETVSEAEEELAPLPCRSSDECPKPTYCTTEDGVCNRPPGCRPGDICPAVCYGTCRVKISLPPSTCGGNICPAGTFCCNASCGTCAPIGGACTQQVCLPKD